MSRNICLLILIINCIISAYSQILLKKAARREYSSFVFQYLNMYVISSYLFFFLVIIINVFLLRYLPISIVNPIAEVLPIIFSFISGIIFFEEKLSKVKILGITVIIAGLFIILV